MILLVGKIDIELLAKYENYVFKDELNHHQLELIKAARKSLDQIEKQIKNKLCNATQAANFLEISETQLVNISKIHNVTVEKNGRNGLLYCYTDLRRVKYKSSKFARYLRNKKIGR